MSSQPLYSSMDNSSWGWLVVINMLQREIIYFFKGSKELKLRTCFEEACSIHIPCVRCWLAFVSSSGIKWENCCGFFFSSPATLILSAVRISKGRNSWGADLALLQDPSLHACTAGLPCESRQHPHGPGKQHQASFCTPCNAWGGWRGTGFGKGMWAGMKHRAGQKRCWPCAGMAQVYHSLPGSCAVLD